jgi:hypothetical protein
MVRSTHVRLEVAEESHNRVRVNRAADIDALAVVDASMEEAFLVEFAVLNENSSL